MSEAPAWHVMQGSEQLGPYTGEQLVGFARSGNIVPDTMVWTAGMESWLPASQIPNLFPQQVAAAQPATGPVFQSASTTLNPYATGALGHGVQGGDTYPAVGVSGASFGAWLGMLLGGIALMLIPLIAAGVAADGSTEISDSSAVIIFVLIAIGAVLVVIAQILSYVNLHRAWRCLQFGGYARTTPGKAVGFMFIPFFNLYWIFQAIGGLATDWNRTAAAYGDLRPAPRLSEGMFLTFCIVMLVFYPLNLIFGPMVMAEICRGINFFAFRPSKTSQGPLGFTLR